MNEERTKEREKELKVLKEDFLNRIEEEKKKKLGTKGYKNLQKLLSNKWLDKKHIKHSKIVFAHFESTVGQSKTGYRCKICEQPGACYKVVNKRSERDTNIRYCWNCKDEIEKIFPVEYDYC